MASSAPPPAKKWERLPASVRPVHYDLQLVPDLQKFTFDGEVQVELEVKESTSVLKLNALELSFSSVEIRQEGEESQQGQFALDEKEAVATLTFPKALEVGKKAVLKIVFQGVHNDQMHGFYRSVYEDSKSGEKKTILCSQFESTDARRAFPCWDEPALKATFTVSLTVPKKLQAVSNMPIASSSPVEAKEGQEELVKHVFDKSVVMSTYLLAFVVGEFDVIEEKTKKGLPVRVFTPPGKAEHGRFALEVAVKCMDLYDEWFEFPYPLPKLDNLSIPDFSAGAMENWGVVTYRETALLLDPVNSSSLTKQWVAIVVAHELAHQWFGNAVTMEWWTDLWLNEGFASFVEYFAVNEIFPEWKVWDQFVSSDFNRALSLDCLENSHPIEVEVNHPDEVSEIFDMISYSKGSVVVRMLQTWLGREAFYKAIAAYIRKFQYRNAVSKDLWATLQEVSGKPVSDMMQGWTKQVGFPVVKVESAKQEGQEIVYEVSQTRFTVEGPKEGDQSLWYCPVAFLASGHSLPLSNQVFHTAKGQLRLQLPEGVSRPAFVKLNAGQTGFYRVLYTPEMLQALSKAVAEQDAVLSCSDRLGIQNDAFAFARAGLISPQQLLELVAAYRNEEDYSVWLDLSSNLLDLGGVLAADPLLYAAFSKFASSLFSKIMAQVGWEAQPNESHSQALLRSRIIAVLGAKFHDAQVVSEAVSRFVAYFTALTAKDEAGEAALPADLRAAAYQMAVASGGPLGYEMVLQLIKTAPSSEEKVRLITSLGSATSPALLVRTLQYALSDEVRKQDSPSLLAAVGNNPLGLPLFWQFLQDNWATIVSRFGGSYAISRIIDVLRRFSSLDKVQEIEQFFADPAHPAPSGERAVKQALETIKSNHKWFAAHSKGIEQWLQQNVA